MDKGLPKLTKTMFESYEKWSSENFNSTLLNKNQNLEKILTILETLDVWANLLLDIDPSESIMPEIYFDAYVSIHFACMGLYKYAYVCLRSQLETALRLIYFSTHPIEYKWWMEGNEWYRSGLKARDVWGEGFNYFANMKLIKKFDNVCDSNRKLFSNGGTIKRNYKQLSKYVHTSSTSFQTKADRFSPAYEEEMFRQWEATFTNIQDYMNVLFILGFIDKYNLLEDSEKNKILTDGIQSDFYREKISNLLKELKE